MTDPQKLVEQVRDDLQTIIKSGLINPILTIRMEKALDQLSEYLEGDTGGDAKIIKQSLFTDWEGCICKELSHPPCLSCERKAKALAALSRLSAKAKFGVQHDNSVRVKVLEEVRAEYPKSRYRFGVYIDQKIKEAGK